jgi:hypothetical protein
VVLAGPIPEGARKARIRLGTVNHFGTNSTYCFDDLALKIGLLEVARPSFRGALATLATARPIASSSTTPVAWSAVDIDTDGFWAAGSPTRLTVPEGVSRVRLQGNVRWQNNGTGIRHLSITRNGADFPGQPMMRQASGGLVGQNLTTPGIAVRTGDYFELTALQNAGTTVDIEASVQSWFAIEVVE